MTAEKIAIAKLDGDITSLNHRMTEAEKNIKAINDIATSVKELAVNMRYMADEQKEQGERLERLENEPLENVKFSKRALVTGILSAIGSAIVTAAIAVLYIFSAH